MITKNTLLLWLATALLLLAAGCEEENEPTFVPATLASMAPKVFGFYTYPLTPDAIADQSSFVNMVDISIGFDDSSKQNALSLLQIAKSNNLKAKLNLSPYMFRKGDPSGAEQALWDQMVQDLKPFENTIGAFYTTDEPYWNAWTALGKPSELSSAQKLQASNGIKPELERMNAALKTAFPNIPSALVEGWPVLAAHIENRVPWTIPAGYDWVGIDCYDGDFNNCNGHSIPAYYNAIKAKLSTNQMMIMVPPSHIQFPAASNAEPSDKQKKDLRSKIEEYEEFALSDPKVVGMWMWMYSVNGTGKYVEGSTQFRGYSSLPADVQSIFQNLGKVMLNPSSYKP